MRGEMIDILREVFIGVLYLFGIGFFGFFAVFLYVLAVRIWRERK